MNNKKGQLTIFIIIAIVIVVGIVAFFVLRDSNDLSEHVNSNRENIEKVSSQVSAVYLSVDDYLEDTI